MGIVSKPARELWRDYVTEGVPGTGAHKPVKSDIRQWGLEVEAALGAVAGAKSVKSYGAVGDGTTADQVAFANATATAQTIYVPPGTYRISANTTLPAGCRWVFDDGAQISVDAGVTVTFRGDVAAGWRRVFAGAGTVTGIRHVRPEWFGAERDGVTNDQPALQKAHDCIEGAGLTSDGGDNWLEFGYGTYALASALILRPTANNNLRVDGSGSVFGTRFLAKAAFTGGSCVVVEGQTDSIQKIADFYIGNFSIVAEAGTTCTTGLWVGGTSAGKSLIGTKESIVENIYIEGFQITHVLNQCRLVTFRGCGFWPTQTGAGSIAAQIQLSDVTQFTGDCDYDNCEFSGATGTNRTGLKITHASTGQIKGLRFNKCVFYHFDYHVQIVASGGADIGDVWFSPGCQFDGVIGGGANQQAIYIDGSGAGSTIDDIQVRGCYLRGMSATAGAVQIRQASSADVRSIFVDENWFANCNTGIVQVGTVHDISVDENSFVECQSTGALIDFQGTANKVSASNNHAWSTGGAVSAASIVKFAAACDRIAAVNNKAGSGYLTGSIVDDLTPTTAKKVIFDQDRPLTERLTANRTYYVRTDGSDSNTGLSNTAGGAFLTIQKAVDEAALLNAGPYSITIQVADGTYAANVALRRVQGWGTCTIQGNSGTPGNVVIGAAGGSAIEGIGPMRWTVKDFKAAAAATRGINAEDNAVVLFSNIVFAGATSAILRATVGGQVRAIGNFNVEGNAAFLWVCGPLGQIDTSSRTITFANSPAFSTATAYADTLSSLSLFTMTFTNGGSVTGKRYQANNNGVINTNGGGANYVPGNSAGSTSNGLYI